MQSSTWSTFTVHAVILPLATVEVTIEKFACPVAIPVVRVGGEPTSNTVSRV